LAQGTGLLAKMADFHNSFDSFGFSSAGIVTDYAISLVSIICAGVAYSLREKAQQKEDHEAPGGITVKLYMTFCLFASAAAVTFFFGGLGHMLIAVYANGSGALGKQWGSANSQWMYAWVLAVFFMPVTALANLAIMLAAYDKGKLALAVAYALGLCIGAVEAVLMSSVSLLTTYSGAPSAALFLLSGCICIVMACIKAIRERKEKGVGMWVVMVGNILICLGWLVVGLAPAGCTKYSQAVRDCPYPNEFNQNAVFHIIIIAAVVTQFFGVKAYANENEKRESLYLCR